MSLIKLGEIEIKNIIPVRTLLDSLSASIGQTPCLIDPSIIVHLPDEYRDKIIFNYEQTSEQSIDCLFRCISQETTDLHAEFYSGLTQIIEKDNVMIAEKARGEMIKIFGIGRLKLSSLDQIASVHNFALAAEKLSRAISHKTARKPSKEAVLEIESVGAARCPRLMNLCSKEDRETVTYAIELAAKGEKITIASRDSNQLKLADGIAGAMRLPLQVITYDWRVCNFIRTKYSSYLQN